MAYPILTKYSISYFRRPAVIIGRQVRRAFLEQCLSAAAHPQNPIPTDYEELLSRQVTLAAQNQELAGALAEAVKLIEQLSAENPNTDDSVPLPDQPRNCQKEPDPEQPQMSA